MATDPQDRLASIALLRELPQTVRHTSPLKKSPLAWFHSTAIHMAAKAVLPS